MRYLLRPGEGKVRAKSFRCSDGLHCWHAAVVLVSPDERPMRFRALLACIGCGEMRILDPEVVTDSKVSFALPPGTVHWV